MVHQHDPPLDQFDLCTILLSSHHMLTLNSQAETSPSKQRHYSVFPSHNDAYCSANSTQALRIRTLESDVRRLLDENLGLRTELIQIKCQLARQSQSSNLIESARSAQQALENVLLDVAGIKNGLENSLQIGITPFLCC